MSDHFQTQGKGGTTGQGAPAPAAQDTGLSRRCFLTTGAGVGTVLAVPGLLGATVTNAGAAPGEHHMGMSDHGAPDTIGVRPAPFTEGVPLVEPEVRRSVDGELRTTLRVQYAYKDVGGYRLFLRTYEGTIPGPTLRVRRGDVLRIRLVNDLPPNRDPMPAYTNQPHHLNTTNLHLHGSHVSPSGIADNVMRSMLPGQSYDIEIAIPADHTAGTLWYHPHHHGSADIQIASGMAGAVIIEGDFDGVPEIAAARERLMVLGEVVFDAFGTVEDFDDALPRDCHPFPHRQRPAGADDRHAAGGGTALAPAARGLSGRYLSGASKATGCTRSRATASRLRAWASRKSAPRSMPTTTDGDPDGAGPAHRCAGAGGGARHVRAARAALRPGLCVAHRAHRPRGGRRRAACDEAARDASAVAARRHSRRGDHRHAPAQLLVEGARGERRPSIGGSSGS